MVMCTFFAGDEVLFDDRCVASSTGLFHRDTIYGLGIKGRGVKTQATNRTSGEVRLLLNIDTKQSWSDWDGEMRPRGVRLETANEALIAFGSLGPHHAEQFRALYTRTIKTIGLS